MSWECRGVLVDGCESVKAVCSPIPEVEVNALSHGTRWYCIHNGNVLNAIKVK